MKYPGNQDGYVALLSVLIVGTIATVVDVTLLITGVDAQRETLVTQQSAQARGLTDACTEEALQQLHDNTAFTGSNNLTLALSTCTYTVTSTGSSTRTITSSATVGNVVRKVIVYVTMSSSSISITSWQEVG